MVVTEMACQGSDLRRCRKTAGNADLLKPIQSSVSRFRNPAG
jgi:hypothetical protein